MAASIVLPTAQNASEEELRADIRFLKGLWNDIKTRAEASKPPALIYHDLNVVERVLRDQVTSDFSVIWVDTEPEYERILRFFNRFQPGLVKRVKLYTKETPLFEQFGLKEEMDKALKSKVWLKSGGYIVINQDGSAGHAIDINTGKYVGKTSRLGRHRSQKNQRWMRSKKSCARFACAIWAASSSSTSSTWMSAATASASCRHLKKNFATTARHRKFSSSTIFGLVNAINTRKRVKQSLEIAPLARPSLPSIHWIRKVSVTTICNEIYVEMRKIAKHSGASKIVMLRVNPDVAKELKANKSARLLNEMEELEQAHHHR